MQVTVRIIIASLYNSERNDQNNILVEIIFFQNVIYHLC